MRRAAAQVATTFAVLASAGALLLVQAPTATASPHHARPTAAAARAQAGRQGQPPAAHGAAARAPMAGATRHPRRPSHPAPGHHAAKKGSGAAHHAARRSARLPQRAVGPEPVALVAAQSTAATARHGARRAAAPQPAEPAARHGRAAAAGSRAGAPNPLRKLADGLSRLTHSSLLRGPLGWLILAMAVLALFMIAAAYASGRGGAGQFLRRALISAR